MLDIAEFKNMTEEEAVAAIKNGISPDISALKLMLKNHDSVAKDVCKFYGISHEQYIEIVSAIGRTSDLKEFGIEIDESKLSNAGEKRHKEKK